MNEIDLYVLVEKDSKRLLSTEKKKSQVTKQYIWHDPILNSYSKKKTKK